MTFGEIVDHDHHTKAAQQAGDDAGHEQLHHGTIRHDSIKDHRD
jgi:hypothetical protein